jgi:hypothetical protein
MWYHSYARLRQGTFLLSNWGFLDFCCFHRFLLMSRIKLVFFLRAVRRIGSIPCNPWIGQVSNNIFHHSTLSLIHGLDWRLTRSHRRDVSTTWCWLVWPNIADVRLYISWCTSFGTALSTTRSTLFPNLTRRIFIGGSDTRGGDAHVGDNGEVGWPHQQVAILAMWYHSCVRPQEGTFLLSN